MSVSWPAVPLQELARDRRTGIVHAEMTTVLVTIDQAGGDQAAERVLVENNHVVEDRIPWSCVIGKRLPELPDDPLGVGLSGDGEVHNGPAGMVDDEENPENLKLDGGHCEEVDAGQDIAVVAQESAPD